MENNKRGKKNLKIRIGSKYLSENNSPWINLIRGIETHCILVEKVVYRVKSMMNANNYDIVKAGWLLKCIDAGHFIPWSPGDMIHTSPTTQKLFQQDFDYYGDSFSEDTTPERLKDVFSKITVDPDDCVSHNEVAEMEENFFPDESPYGLFRTCKIYLDNKLIIGDESTHIKNSSLDFLKLELRFFGAQVTDSWSADVSHVMCDKSDLSRVQQFREERRKRQKKFHIVTERWVRECMEEGSLVDARHFEPDLPSR